MLCHQSKVGPQNLKKIIFILNYTDNRHFIYYFYYQDVIKNRNKAKSMDKVDKKFRVFEIYHQNLTFQVRFWGFFSYIWKKF